MGGATLQGIRIEVRSTYWIEEKPKGWTNKEWTETIEAAMTGDTDHDGLDALLDGRYAIESEVEDVFWEEIPLGEGAAAHD